MGGERGGGMRLLDREETMMPAEEWASMSPSMVSGHMVISHPTVFLHDSPGSAGGEKAGTNTSSSPHGVPLADLRTKG